MSVESSATVPIKPRALRRGDTIAVVAPAGPVDADALEAGCRSLNELGYATVYLESITERDQYFAGSAERRLAEFREMMMRADVAAVICARGGYGCNYLLPGLDADALRRNPKVFIGYSDVTTIITWMVDNGLVALHGPMVAKDFAHGGAELQSFGSVVSGSALSLSLDQTSGVSVLREGAAEGVLYGGCLSLLVQSLGTPYEIQTNGKLLFVEDVSVHPYQVDRMLMHLRLAGKLEGVRGFVFGPFAGTEPDEEACLREAIVRTLDGFDVPIVFGVPSGHVASGNITLPMGVAATMTAHGSVELKCEAAAEV